MEGPQWTTGSIGRRCKPGNGLSRPVLIGRHEPHTHTHTHAHPPARERRGGPRTQPPRPLRSPEPTHPPPTKGPATTAHHTPPPSRRPQRAGKRPEPYRTRKLSPPAPMVLPPPGSGRVGHHRNTHQPHRPARGRRPNQAPTPTRAGPTPAGRTHTHTLTTQRRLFSGLMVALGPLALRWTTAVRPSFPRAKCASRRPGRSGAGRRGPRDRRVTAEHVTQPARTSARGTCSRVK